MTRLEWKTLIEGLYPDKQDRRRVIEVLRLALTGQDIGPDIYAVMEILGNDTVKQRFFKFIEYYDLRPFSDSGSTLPL